MDNTTRYVWNALRVLIKDGNTFAEIKDYVAASGLPLNELSHLVQGQLPTPGASKSDLLDGVGELLEKAESPEEALSGFVDVMLSRKPSLEPAVERAITRFGWN